METPYALGRLVGHDPRSLNYRAAPSGEIKTTEHKLFGATLNQGDVGSCTGNALAHLLNTDPFYPSAPPKAKLLLLLERLGLKRRRPLLLQKNALSLYKIATKIDGVPGIYPPNDTGSTGLAVCKAGVMKRWLSGYEHAFGLDHMLQVLSERPVIIGTLWTQDMFNIDSAGFVKPTGQDLGGHEYMAFGLNVEEEYVRFRNSWGDSWSPLPNGEFRIRFADLDWLLHEDGDVTVPLPKV